MEARHYYIGVNPSGIDMENKEGWEVLRFTIQAERNRFLQAYGQGRRVYNPDGHPMRWIGSTTARDLTKKAIESGVTWRRVADWRTGIVYEKIDPLTTGG